MRLFEDVEFVLAAPNVVTGAALAPCRGKSNRLVADEGARLEDRAR